MWSDQDLRPGGWSDQDLRPGGWSDQDLVGGEALPITLALLGGHSMSLEGIDEFDEWDEGFLKEAIRFELEAISSRNPPSSIPNPSSLRPLRPLLPPPPVDLNTLYRPPPQPEPEAFSASNPIWVGTNPEAKEAFPPIPSFWFDSSTYHDAGSGFLPPRKRLPEQPNSSRLEADCGIAEPSSLRNGAYGGRAGIRGIWKDKKVKRLKEHECVELKKEKAKKDEQLKSAFSQIEAKDAEIHSLRKATLEASKQNLEVSNQTQNTGIFAGQLSAVSDLKRPTLIDNGLTNSRGTLQESSFHQKTTSLKSNKTIGIQTDSVQDCSHISLKDLSMEQISNKLLAICGLLDNGKMGGNRKANLLVSTSKDFCALFRCMNMPSTMHPDYWVDHDFSSDMVSHDGPQPITSIDVAKVCRVYEMLMKVHNDMEQLNALLEALLELCTTENVFVVHRSLRILHTILQHLLSCNLQSDIRNNVLIDQSLNNFQGERRFECKSEIMDFYNSEKACGESETSDLFLTDIISFDLENLRIDKDESCIYSTHLSSCWVSIVETMQQIALKNKKEYIQIESVSIMILILMRSDLTTDKEKFGMPVLECVSQLLQKESGLPVQKQAVHLLFLLLNCPKTLMMFCTSGKDGAEHAETADGHKSALQRSINLILEGLSECLACGTNCTLGLQLRRQVIMLLAVLASYGKSGFEVLINSTRTQEVNFLELIIQVLASQLDAEIADSANAQAVSKERALLVRDALILLNRFASHRSYSRATLQAVTRRNSTARLTIEVANRLPQKDGRCWRPVSTKKTQMEAEITDLARSFRAKVFAFLREKRVNHFGGINT